MQQLLIVSSLAQLKDFETVFRGQPLHLHPRAKILRQVSVYHCIRVYYNVHLHIRSNSMLAVAQQTTVIPGMI